LTHRSRPVGGRAQGCGEGHRAAALMHSRHLCSPERLSNFIYCRLRKATRAVISGYSAAAWVGICERGGATDMAIAQDVLGRLARFNTARRDKSDEDWRFSEGQRDSRQPRASRLTRALL